MHQFFVLVPLYILLQTPSLGEMISLREKHLKKRQKVLIFDEYCNTKDSIQTFPSLEYVILFVVVLSSMFHLSLYLTGKHLMICERVRKVEATKYNVN